MLREESEREEADKKCVVNVKFVEGRPENATNGCKSCNHVPVVRPVRLR